MMDMEDQQLQTSLVANEINIHNMTDLKIRTCKSTRYTLCQNNYIKLLFSLFYMITFIISSIDGTVTVITKLSNESIIVFEDQPAGFVPDRVAAYGIQGYAVYANPQNACSTVDKPPDDMNSINANWILVARRFDCDFQIKIENAQKSGYSAIIVHNVGSNDTEAMGADNPSKLIIYACFIGEYDGELLRDVYSYTKDKQYYIRIQDDFSMNGYLLPFAIVVGVCFIVMLIFMLWQQVVRWLRERQRSRRRKLPSSALKKLPITKWTKTDPYETCAICLEDFIEQDKIRVLPCSHGYHSVCIDPWLTKGRRVCPICKRKVILADERFPLSDTDTDDESAPLLGSASTSSNAPNPASSTSTFVQHRENPFHRAIRRARLGHSTNSNSSSDSTSTTGSEESETNGHLITSYQSLPVLAQVHSLTLPSNSSQPNRFFVPSTQSGVGIHPILNNNTNTTSSSQSQFYVSCEEEPEDEEMLDLTIESHDNSILSLSSISPPPIEIAVEAPSVVICDNVSLHGSNEQHRGGTNSIV